MTAKNADMTVAQAMDIRKMATAKGVPRKLIQDNTGQLALALDAIKSGSRLKIIPAIQPPEWGGRVHTLRLRVVEDQPWPEAVANAGSDTSSGSNVHKVCDLYLPTSAGTHEVELVLVSLTGGGDFAKAVSWSQQYDLKRSNPRQVFALGKHKPNLHQELAMDPMYVTASQECSFDGDQRVCSVWWYGSEREAGLFWTGHVRYAYDWVAFARESL